MRQAGQLGGFLQVGPHYFPDRRANGVQIIMRGPHGQRLAANPVYLREHDQPRGSGFRFWTEELNIPPDVEWNPQQVVTGVMGLGSLGGAFDRLRYASEIHAAISSQPVGIARQAASEAASALQSAISQSARQNEKGAQDALVKAASQTARVRGHGAPALANLLDRELNENVYPIVSQHFGRTPDEQARYMRGVIAQEQAWERYVDPASSHAGILRAEEERARHSGKCVSWLRTPANCLEDIQGSLVKTLLVGGAVVLGVVALSSFAKGAGAGLASAAGKK
jgi:hypothetical protein